MQSIGPLQDFVSVIPVIIVKATISGLVFTFWFGVHEDGLDC